MVSDSNAWSDSETEVATTSELDDMMLVPDAVRGWLLLRGSELTVTERNAILPSTQNS